MKVLPHFPAYASGNCDVVTKSSQLGPDDRVIVLDRNAEDLPVGIMCINSRTVDMMVNKLGKRIYSDIDDAVLKAALDKVEELETQLEAFTQLRDAMEALTS